MALKELHAERVICFHLDSAALANGEQILATFEDLPNGSPGKTQKQEFLPRQECWKKSFGFEQSDCGLTSTGATEDENMSRGIENGLSLFIQLDRQV